MSRPPPNPKDYADRKKEALEKAAKIRAEREAKQRGESPQRTPRAELPLR
jgi:hypothetical protein